MILKQLVVACAIALGLLIANTHEVEASEFKSKDLYTLEDPTWFRNEGFTKGIGHDKQDFGVLLRPGGTIEVRQTNANFKELVTIELLNDDDKTEKAVKVGSDWVSIKADVASVPFAVTTYTTIKPTLEYNVTNAMELPIFKAGENDSSFFRTWDGNQSDFALISNNYIQILVPIKDKKYLMNMEKFANMDELFEYYDTVFETYNELAGISFTPSRPTDKNVGNKYFAKANKSGPAAAYYGGSNAATSGASISEYWLNPHWGNLHEIAHGYQGSFMNDITFSTVEVWNNIYANAFEQKIAGNNYAERWLYKYQPSPTTVENTFQTKVYEDKIPLSSWDVVMKLYALTMMTDKAGLEAFSHFNQEYRQLANEPNFVNTNLLLDMLSKYYAEASDFNMAPFIDLVQGSSSPRQEIQSLYGTAKNVYPAAGLLSGSNLERVKNALSLESKWSLVDNSQLEKYHFSSDATITFDIDDFSQLQGQVLRLKDGGNTLQEIIITQPTMVLKNIPVGIYSIDIPYGLDKIYKIDKYYIPITDETNVINLKMSELKSTEIGTQKMTFKGLGDIIFATATVNPESGTFSLDVTRGSPHSYFDSSYAIVEIFDAAGRMKFRRDMNGLTTQIGHFDAEIEIGDLIRVTHQEISRFSVSGSTTSLVSNQRIQNYEVTKYGLENTSTNNSSLSDYKDRLVKFADAIIEDNRINQQENAIPKAYLEMAINYLDEPDKKMYKDKYGDLFVVKSKDTILYNSALALLESLFNDSSKDTLKTTTTQAEIDVVQGFVNQIVDVAKKAELQKDLDEAQKQLTAKKEAEENAAEISVKELFNNNDVTGSIKDSTNQAAIDNAQQKVDAVTDSKKKAELQKNLDEAQRQFDVNYEYRLKGLGDNTFATIDISMQKMWADINIKAGAPHVYFADTYASIVIQDKAGNEKYAKTFIGADTNQASSVRVPLAIGDEITTYHREATSGTTNRLEIQNEKTKAYLEAATTITYVVTSQGLVVKTEVQAQDKAREAVNNLFENKDPKGKITDSLTQAEIDAAQGLVDQVKDTTKKAELQKDLDRAQALFDLQNSTNTPEFIATKQAVEGLLTSLVSFGQQTDAYGAVKLDTTQAKIYAAQDKLDLVSDQVVEKAALTAQLAKAQDLLIARNNEQIGNRIVNGNFDNALAAWKSWIGSGGSTAPTVVATEGAASNAVKLAPNSSIEQTFQGLKPNTNYILTFYGKVDDGTYLSAGVKNYGGAQQGIRVTSSDYSKGQIAFTTGANVTSAIFYLTRSGSTGTGNAFADFAIAKADNGEDLIPEVIEATNKVDNLFTNLTVVGADVTTSTLYKNGALKLTTKQAEIDAAKAIVDAMNDSYESKADLLAMLKTAQDLWDIRGAADTGNLVKNGEFDSGIANWTPWNAATSTAPTTTQENGNNILRLLGVNDSVQQTIKGLQPNTTYTLEVYGKVESNGYVTAGVKNYGGTEVRKIARLNSNTEYAKASITIRTGPTTKEATIYLMKGAGTGAVFADDVQFKDSTPEGERPEVMAATEALAALFTAQTSVSTTHLTPVTKDNGAIKMTTTDADIATAAEKVAAVPANLKVKATLEAELARATALFANLQASQTANLTKNSQFDSNLTNWKTWAAATAVTPVVITENGNKVVKLEGNSSVEQTITGLLPNTTYTVSMYGKVEAGARLSIGVKSFGGAQANAYVTATTDYAQGTLTFTTGATNTSAIIFLIQGNISGIAYADLVVIK
ncbi:hypothetical protein HCA60_16165 [Listeria booriae]|uniref:putative mucin/carbohydrate-binding domain-containing protein n=1 Tax=Listeria booriae TaxID=1552123 RepID=UPI0016289DB9|nr:putative mucin/carbohydrate-binding domain-containing protein [Listeria booriae]MBC1814032.1 hypothetical protein [Listeria booriae]